MIKRKIGWILLCVCLLWSMLIAVDFFRLTHTESYQEPLIPLGSIHYAYDYSIVHGLGYTVRYDYTGDETYTIQTITFQIFGKTIY